MNRYLIFTNDIHMMGGGQKYTGNKLSFVEKSGWIPCAVYYDNPRGSKIYVKTLERFKDNYVKSCQYPPSYYSKDKIRKIIDCILKMIGYRKNDRLIIESSTVMASLWAELIAAHIHGIHIAYILSESFSGLTKGERDFLYYKYQQNKLFGTNEHTMKLIFGDSDKYKVTAPRFFLAFGGKVFVDEYRDYPTHLSKNKLKICIFGRLDKHFVIPTINDLIKYFNKHQNDEFHFIILGGTDKKKELLPIIKLMKGVNNADFFCTGPVFPIPKNWITDMDVVIATAGSALTAASQDVPTISVCVQNDKPLGILNYTTLSSRDKDINDTFKRSLSDYLDMILYEDYCNKNNKIGQIESEYDYKSETEEFIKQLNIANIEDDKYYPCYRIQYNLTRRIKSRVYNSYHLRMIWHRIKLKYNH